MKCWCHGKSVDEWVEELTADEEDELMAAIIDKRMNRRHEAYLRTLQRSLLEDTARSTGRFAVPTEG